MLSLNLAVLCLAATARLAHGYPFKVPEAACVDMSPKGPGHNNMEPQNSVMPFDTGVSNSKGSSDITISQKPGGPTFAGFMVQARSGSSPTPLGTFSSSSQDVQAVQCSSPDDTGSHTNPDPKERVTLTWKAPANFKGKVDFYVTVAETKYKFWVKQKIGSVTL